MASNGVKRRMEHQEIIEHYTSETINRRQNVPVTHERREYDDGTRTLPFSKIPTETSAQKSTTDKSFDKRHRLTDECSYQVALESLDQASPVPYRDQSLEIASNLNRSIGNIDSYGYDVHEIHTSDGGARIVQAHGSGVLQENASSMQQLDRSLSEQRFMSLSDKAQEQAVSSLRKQFYAQPSEPRIASSASNGQRGSRFPIHTKIINDGLQQSAPQRTKIYTIPSPSSAKGESWRHAASTDENSLQRKDSYKRMQLGQDEAVGGCTPQSDKALIIGGDKRRAYWQRTQAATPIQNLISSFCQKLTNRSRDVKCSPRLLCLLLLLILLVILFLTLLGIITAAIFQTYSVRKLILYPPACSECAKKGIYERNPSTVYIHYHSPSQAHFELIGNTPFKSNSFTAVDFETGYVAIADHALTDEKGIHTTCFVTSLDRTALPSMEALKDALSGNNDEVHSEFGWQEYWQYHAEPIDGNIAQRKFSSLIETCINSKWYLLKHTFHTKYAACSDCYDFCLPDYGYQRLHKYEDQMTLGVRRLNCFRLYVPEWSKFQSFADSDGGRWSYPKLKLPQI